uniref:Pco130633 n=1 Tax=Arundo donax TaxID=35708 RepID=A0A0A9HXQ0_ARUDO
MSVLPLSSKICISHVLMNLLLSITVSLPTSKRPISFGLMLYFSSRDVTTVKLIEITSSTSL